MPQHKVTMEMPPRTVGNADAIFKVHADGKMAGTLTVSKGALVWFPPNTKKGYKLNWVKFAELMKEHATHTEKR